MADPEALSAACGGVAAWREWRQSHPSNMWLESDLTYLSDPAYVAVAGPLRDKMPQPFYADLSSADLRGVDLRGSDLSGVVLSQSNLERAMLSGADLERASLDWANLAAADLSNARLVSARLEFAQLSQAELTGAHIEGCSIYGVATWDVNLSGATQKDLVINHPSGSLWVDSIDTAQFLCLLLDQRKLRETIDALTTKTVLILGRFTDERKAILDAIRDSLRRLGYVPLMFDFTRPAARNFTETISTLAHMSRFVIADLTDAKVVLQELQAIVPHLPSVPVQPILLAGEDQNVVSIDFEDHASFLKLYRYTDARALVSRLREDVIGPPEARFEAIVARRRGRPA